MNRAQHSTGFCRKARLCLANQRCGSVLLAFETVLYDGFNGQRTCHFAMSFAAHSVREYKKSERRNDAKAVFIVGAHHAHMGGATARDLQGNSPGRRRKHLRAHPNGLSDSS